MNLLNNQIGSKPGQVARILALSALLMSAISVCNAETLPPSTAIPVEFSSTLIAGKLKVGDPVAARTMQVVMLPDGTQIPKGTVLAGHVTESTPFHFDNTAYAVQKQSRLGVQFDKIELKGGSLPVHLALRAIASVYAVTDASRPANSTDDPTLGLIYQVGGDYRAQRDDKVLSPSGNVVEYVRKNGIFAHLLASEAANSAAGLQCDAVGTEQSVAVFSAGACGLYGFDRATLEQNGSNGAILLATSGITAEIPAHSAALLEVMQ